jgi:hypothetical protein
VPGGKPAGEFRTFAGAVAELRQGDEVTVQGNGPYKVGPVKVEGMGLTIRAGAGFRPRLEMGESVAGAAADAWFVVRGGGLTVEGCDLVGTAPVRFFHSAGGPLHLRRCRLLSCGSIGTYERGPEVRLEGCLIHCYYGLNVGDPGAAVEVTQCIAVLDNHLLIVHAGGSAVRLRGNTLSLGYILADVAPREGGKPATLDLANNLVVSAPYRTSPSLLQVGAKDWQPSVRWLGHDNLYAGPLAPPKVRHPTVSGWTDADAAPWDKVVAAEKGSRKVERVSLAWNDAETPTAPGALAALGKALDEARRRPGLAGVGPDLDRLGPGEGYRKALEGASGQAIPKERLRPAAEEGGPFVLLRGGRVVRGCTTLPEAFDAAANGDTIEVRTDGPRPTGTLAAGKGALTLRAAPGYRPVLTGTLLVGGKTSWPSRGCTSRREWSPTRTRTAVSSAPPTARSTC